MSQHMAAYIYIGETNMKQITLGVLRIAPKGKRPFYVLTVTIAARHIHVRRMSLRQAKKMIAILIKLPTYIQVIMFSKTKSNQDI